MIAELNNFIDENAMNEDTWRMMRMRMKMRREHDDNDDDVDEDDDDDDTRELNNIKDDGGRPADVADDDVVVHDLPPPLPNGQGEGLQAHSGADWY